MKGKLRKGGVLCALVAGGVVSSTVFAAGDGTAKADAGDTLDSRWRPAFAMGFSRPLVVSMSLGAMLPLGHQDPLDPFPSSPALRVDGQLGLGGGDVGAGLFVPVVAGGYEFSVCVKAERMRTWGLTWDASKNRTYDGAVVELALPSAHGGPKLGLGSFRDTAPMGGVRRSFTYVFIGLGW